MKAIGLSLLALIVGLITLSELTIRAPRHSATTRSGKPVSEHAATDSLLFSAITANEPRCRLIFGPVSTQHHKVSEPLSDKSVCSRHSSAFDDLVSAVVGVRSLEQMRTPHASWIVATVQRERFWPAPLGQEERYPVSANRLSSDPEQPIAKAAHATSPYMTWAQFRAMRRHRPVLVDLRPKQCDRFLVHAGNLRVGQRPGRVEASRGALARLA
jgi:hypothetical protein